MSCERDRFVSPKGDVWFVVNPTRFPIPKGGRHYGWHYLCALEERKCPETPPLDLIPVHIVDFLRREYRARATVAIPIASNPTKNRRRRRVITPSN